MIPNLSIASTAYIRDPVLSRSSASAQLRDAVRLGRIADVDRLIAEHPHIIDDTNEDGLAALHIAICTEKNCGDQNTASYPILKLIINSKANVNVPTHAGDSPLHLSVKHGDEVKTDLLLQAGSNIHAVDARGDSPLHIAVTLHFKRMEQINVLCKYGDSALLESINQTGETVFDILQNNAIDIGENDLLATRIDGQRTSWKMRISTLESLTHRAYEKKRIESEFRQLAGAIPLIVGYGTPRHIIRCSFRILRILQPAPSGRYCRHSRHN